MERRFKLGLVSNHAIVNAGDNFEMKLHDSIPEGVKILSKHNDHYTASLALILYHPEWEEVPLGQELEKFVIDIQESLIERV